MTKNFCYLQKIYNINQISKNQISYSNTQLRTFWNLDFGFCLLADREFKYTTMIIYNVTVNIEDSVHEEWLAWIKEHIPLVLSTGKFTEAKLTRVLIEEEMGGVTYSIQYRAKSREDLDSYYKNHADILRQAGLKRFADKMLAFRTELEIIDEYSVNFN